MEIAKKAQIRHDRIRAILDDRDMVTVRELVDTLQVSEATIRNDLAYLEQQHCIKRILGGAISNEHTLQNTSFRLRKGLSIKEKNEIGAYIAVNMIIPHSVVALDAGTTCLSVAQHLVQKQIPCTIITYSLAVAFAVYSCPSITLYLAGGRFDHEHESFHDENTLPMLETLKSDLFVLSCNGIDESGAITSSASDENMIKKELLKNSAACIVACSHDKLAKRTIKQLLKVEDANQIVIDDDADARSWIQERGWKNVAWAAMPSQ